MKPPLAPDAKCISSSLSTNRLRRTGRDQDPIDQKAAAELLHGLGGVGRLEKFLEASVVSLLRAHLVGKVGQAHAGAGLGEIDVVLRRHFHQTCFRSYRGEIAPLLLIGVSL
jgi:hypothetical protein